MSDKKLVEAFILECKQEQEWKQRYKDNHIDFWDYFKYSGKVEKDTNFIDRYESEHYTHKYGVMLKRPYILKAKDPVVRWYFQNPEESLYSLAIRFNCSYSDVRVRISKYLKNRKDEKGNKIFA